MPITDFGLDPRLHIATNSGQDVFTADQSTSPAAISFNGAQPIPPPVVSGSHGGNVAGLALARAMGALGLIVDQTTP